MIKFGTDGWRAVIGDSFTYENVRKVAHAHAELLKDRGIDRVIVGYDWRFSSEEFALEVYRVFKSKGIDATITHGAVTTPQVSFAVKYMGFGNGVMITASHNPPKYNGYKVKESFGGSATPEFVRQIEGRLRDTAPEVEDNREPKTLNVTDAYIQALREHVNLSVFNERSLTIVHDAMHGTSSGLLGRVLENTKQEVVQLRSYRDTLFGGIAPEPVEKNLGVLKDKVRTYGADIGIANDGDGDRLALVDEKGRFVNTQLIYVLLLLHVLKNRGIKDGKVVKTVSTSFLVDRVCREEGIALEEVSVGFKNINEVILREKVIFGGEESGGYGFPKFIPERDGVFSALMVLEYMLLADMKLSELVDWVFKTYGSAYYKREDFRVDERKKSLLKDLVSNPPNSFGGLKVDRVITKDGLKLVLENDGWLLMRASGTEPLIRIYVETPSENETDRLINLAKELFSK